MDVRERLSELISGDVNLREIEPHIYSVLEEGASAAYDKWGGIYEAVACNRIYNRLIWGYWISEFNRLCTDAIISDTGWMLDVGCGSMAFTAKTYLAHKSRPFILSDQSIWMLRTAKKRVIKLNGSIPENIIFIHADATDLPFRDKAFTTIIVMNLLHSVKDAERIVGELRRVCPADGSILLTTLLRTGRYADSYLHKLAEDGAIVERDTDQLTRILLELGMAGSYSIKGNMAFANLGKKLDFFASADSTHIALKSSEIIKLFPEQFSAEKNGSQPSLRLIPETETERRRT